MKIKDYFTTKWLFFSALLLILSSCEKDQENLQTTLPGIYENGVFICNEGPFMSGTGTISFYNNSEGKVFNDLFEQVNQIPLGNIVQSMEVVGNEGFIVVNNANKIEVVNLTDMSSNGKISGLTLPRYFLSLDGQRAYVSCWDNTIALVNLKTKTVEKKIPTNTGPERMLQSGDLVFVLNQGGFDIDSCITVINTSTHEVLTNLEVYPKPSGIVADKEGKIWVTCSGKGYNGWPAAGDTEGHLLRIDPQSLSIIRDIPFPGTSVHPDKLVINRAGDRLYYLYAEGVYELGIGEETLHQEAFIRHAGNLYTLGLDQKTDMLYLSDPLDYVQDGWVIRYQAPQGFAVDSFKTGIIPTYFCFQ